MIDRARYRRRALRLLREFPVVGIIGPRQVGKTTLAKQVATAQGGRTTSFDLERPGDLANLDVPMLALEELRGLVVVDEVQRRPELFPALRVLADRRPRQSRFLLLGSASPELLRQTSETLAGRIAYLQLGGFDLSEVGRGALERLWLRGGFPRSFLARTEEASRDWRREFIRDFLERELPQLGFRVPSVTLRRFWTMLAHHHGQVWNASEFARSSGVADTSVRRYLDQLTATFVVRQLKPWHENLAKRQVKAPKVYIADSGLLHALLGIADITGLRGHPKAGASWEGFALQVVTRELAAHPEECHFWRTHAGAELDLLVVHGGRRLGFEFKLTDAPTLTPSMRTALRDLKLDSLDVTHAGKKSYRMAPSVRALPLGDVRRMLKPLRR